MDGHNGLPMEQQSRSTATIEQFRMLLQAVSKIPSKNLVQGELQRTETRTLFPDHSQQITGTSFCNIPNTGSQIGNSLSLNPVDISSQAVGVNVAGASNTPGLLVRPVPDGMGAVKYPAPDVKSMVFDPGTGYRFDKITGLYYDANAGLFVNKQLNILLKWNPITSTYMMMGSASDLAAPALAQDLARLLGHRETTAAPSTSMTVPHPKSSFPSSLDSVRDTPMFRKERSLSFEEMSPDEDEVVVSQRGRTIRSKEHSPDPGKYDVPTVLRERRRSLSFDEMTPERDTEELPSVFPHESNSPSSDRIRGVSRSPPKNSSRSPRRDYRFRDRRDIRLSQDRDSHFRGSPDRERRTSGRQDYSRSRSPSLSSRRPDNRTRSPSQRSRMRSVSSKSSRLSPCPSTSQTRRRSPVYRPRRSPERGSKERSHPGRRLSPGITGDSKGRRGDSGGRRSHRSPSSNYQFGKRQKNDHTERGQTSRDCRRSRSRCQSAGSWNNRRRSTSRSRTNIRRRSKSRIQSRRSRSPRSEEPKPVDESRGSDPTSNSSKHTPTKSSSQVKDAAKDDELELTQGLNSGFSESFMSDYVSRIHKKNSRNPANIYGRILPTSPVKSCFMMLTPLPHKGDREWRDLELLLKNMLKAEGVTFYSVAIYPGDGGAPCNYCLIRFKNTEEAFRWYMVHEGTIELSSPDGSVCTVFMNFINNNWKCKKCKEQNFSLRHFCHKCFWSVTIKNSPVQVSQLVSTYVGIAGLDCRFLSVEEVLDGLPSLDGFIFETLELLTETNGIPLGLCIFKFNEQHESAAFYRFLQESSIKPIFVNIVSRAGLRVNPILGGCLKDFAASGRGQSKPLVQREESTSVQDKTVVFANPPETDPKNDPLLWWRFVEGYVPKEEGDMLKYLFEEHPLVHIKFESAPPQVILGPLPLPSLCDLMEYRNLLSGFLQSTGLETRISEKISICRAHQFGAPYNFSLLRFMSKNQTKEWFEKNEGNLVLTLENGSTWPVYLHYSTPNWQCPYCHKFNFPIRIQCFSCYKSRYSDHTPVTFEKNPTIFIGITGYQNWCATEELLFSKLIFLRKIKNLTISYLKEPSGVPLGICVLKSTTPGASEVLFNKLERALTDEIAKANLLEPNRPLLAYIV